MIQQQDIVFAALIALILTWVISTFSRVIKVVVTRSSELGYSVKDLEGVIQRCYKLFPIENIRFKGATFQRGMLVRVVTDRKKTIEGKFMGKNADNMVCFLTNSSVIAHALDNIEEMSTITQVRE